MNDNRLEEYFKSELPLNRKERFYTATVLPSLLFNGGLSNLYRFLHQIPGFPIEVDEQSCKDQFLFYTEYNLKESAGKKNVGIEIYTATRDTPDIIIQILKPVKIFVVIEAKMFANVTQNNFSKQMKAQKTAVIEVLKQKYPESSMLHVALVPKKLHFVDYSDAEYKIINWELLIDDANFNVRDNYFYPYLQFALKNYDKLVSSQWGRATTIQTNYAGIDIYLDGKSAKTLWVGRRGGRKVIANDIKKGSWKRKLYGTNKEKPKDGREGNWLSSMEFAEMVDQEDSSPL